MEKTIKIGSTEVRLSNNVAWTMEYRDQFNKDIVPALIPLLSSVVEAVATVAADAGAGEDGKMSISSVAEAIQGRALDIFLPAFQLEFVDVIINVTWAMAKAADPDIPEPKIWVRQFDAFPLDVIIPEVGGLVAKGFVSSKNLKRLKDNGKKLSKSLQPSPSTKSSSQESSEA